MSIKPQKSCLYCQRDFEWRAKWKDCWEQVKFCSKRCQGFSKSRRSQELEALTLKLSIQRGIQSSLCPSEVARSYRKENWKALMPEVMAAARRLHAQGKIVILQKEKAVDPKKVRGPVRLKLLAKNGESA